MEPFFPSEFQDRRFFTEYRIWRAEKTDELGMRMINAMKLTAQATA
jgi:hypothetical protein